MCTALHALDAVGMYFAASLTLSDIFGWACCPDSDEVGSDRALYFQLVAR